MKISDAGVDHLKVWERLRTKAYLPTPNDRWTIGYGHTKGVGQGLTCTEPQAEVWLDEDADHAEDAVNRFVTADITQVQFDVLVSFVFNVGVGAFRRSTLLQVLNQGRHDQVPAQLKRWVYQDGEKLAGLINRRRDEATKYANEVTV